MTQHAQDNQLRERLLQLHESGKTWVWLANKSDVNATSISNFARGRSGLEPPQYKKLLNAFGEGLPGDGGLKVVAVGPAQDKPELRCRIEITGADFTYDGYTLSYTVDGDYKTLELPSGTAVEFGVDE